jgi:hypothetical protein
MESLLVSVQVELDQLPVIHCPHLSHLNPLDFFLWGHLKSLVY